MVVAKGVFSGSNNPAWKGGRVIDKDGYVLILKRDHPFHNNTGYVREHRLIMEQHLGRYLTREEEVHHINGNKQDNRIENLKKLSTAEHTRFHMTKDVSHRICSSCKGKTLITKTGHALWYKVPKLRIYWHCDNCYRRYRRKSNKK